MRGSPNIFEQILMRNRVSRAEAVVTYGESKRKTIEKRTVKRQSFFRLSQNLPKRDYASAIGIREPLKISAEARGESEGIVTYGELFAWR